MALSIVPADDPMRPVTVRGRVVEWLDGDDAWAIIDEVAMKYIGAPYSRDLDRVVALVAPEHQTTGIG